MKNEDKKAIKEVIFWNIVAISFVNILFGIIAGIVEKKCAPSSIAAYINLPYRISCEFTKPRFNLKESYERKASGTKRANRI
jgi:hypothetical protein